MHFQPVKLISLLGLAKLADLSIDPGEQTSSSLAKCLSGVENSFGMMDHKVSLAVRNGKMSWILQTLENPPDGWDVSPAFGPDDRAAKAWHRSILPASYPAPKETQGHPSTENQKLMAQWIQALKAHPGHNGVAFYGPPGIGKTTVLKEHFPTDSRHTLWVESHTLTDYVNLPEEIAASDAEYVIIDDYNDPKRNQYYQILVSPLFNNEVLFNKQDVPVRVILVSNRKSWEELISDTISEETFHLFLSPSLMKSRLAGMKSRYARRFASVTLSADQDFRATEVKRGLIVKPGTLPLPSPASQLSVAQYIEEVQKKRKEWLYYDEQKRIYDGNGEFRRVLKLSDADEKLHDITYQGCLLRSAT